MPSKDPKIRNATNKRWKDKNKFKIRQQENTRRNTPEFKQKRKEKQQELRKEVFKLLGNQCVCCGESTFEFLAIDHINGGGRQERLKVRRGSEGWSQYLLNKGVPKDEYQILCHNCNSAKGYYGKCPHEK